MSLPNLSSDSGDHRDPAGMSFDASDESASLPADKSGYRAAPDFAIESGLDGFASEEIESDAASGDASAAPDARSRINVVSMATRALWQSGVTVAGAPGRARIASLIPRVISTAALVGQTSARVTHSLSATLTRPRWQIDYRLAGLLLLAIVAFAELWWVSHRLSNPAESLAQSPAVPPAPVVTESVEDVVSEDAAGGAALRMRMTFRSVTPAGSSVDRTAPSWVAISAPMPVEIFEHGQRIGTSWNGGMKLTPGPHDLRIVNRGMGIDLPRSVEAVGGAMASLSIVLPPGILQITAVPWATVDVDGVEIGKTPLSKVELSPGRHDVVFTHPKFGKRKTTITINSGKPQRLSVDLRRRGR
jgi:PEGA domain-containing protein